MNSSEELSPNQRRKRQQIVEAARRVLAEQGLAACSVRAIADASPLTKSAIHYYFADINELVDEGLIDDPPLIQLCMGIPYGAPEDLATLLAMVGRLPRGAVFSTFAIGRMQLAYAALAPIVVPSAMSMLRG